MYVNILPFSGKGANLYIYADIRQQFSDLNDDKELVKYFTMVLARRDELDSQRKE